MSIKSKIFATATATAATLTMAGGLGAAGTLTANAATPSCGHRCIDIFSREFGTHKHPAFVLDVLQGKAKAGQPIILWSASNHDAAQDFTISFQGTVHQFFKAGLASAALDLHYANDTAYEIQYTPNGVDSNMCVGVGSTAANGTPVALEPCGASARTVWAVDSRDTIRGFYVPLINGSDTSFSHPFVLNYPGGVLPTSTPRPQLTTWNLSTYSNGTVFDNQMWGANFGILP
jgi:hypothetical protein